MVKALPKSGDKADCNNHRPITVLPKVSHLTGSNILTPKQFGFRRRLSTDIALAGAQLDDGMMTEPVSLDLTKAFCHCQPY